jgi:hypothetical protein
MWKTYYLLCNWDFFYYGLWDLRASISVVPNLLYMDINSDIDPIDIEETCMTIQLASKEVICHVGIVREVEVLVGKTKYLVHFMVLACPQDIFYPIIFGRHFLHTTNACKMHA